MAIQVPFHETEISNFQSVSLIMSSINLKFNASFKLKHQDMSI